jgi:hypothetical protein
MLINGFLMPPYPLISIYCSYSNKEQLIFILDFSTNNSKSTSKTETFTFDIKEMGYWR